MDTSPEGVCHPVVRDFSERASVISCVPKLGLGNERDPNESRHNKKEDLVKTKPEAGHTLNQI